MDSGQPPPPPLPPPPPPADPPGPCQAAAGGDSASSGSSLYYRRRSDMHPDGGNVVTRSDESEVLDKDDYSQLEADFFKCVKPLIARQRDQVKKAIAEQKDIPVLREQEEQEFYSIMPPIESYMAVGGDDREKAFFASVKVGDLLICKVDRKTETGLICLVMATDAGVRRYMTESGAAVFCSYLNAVQRGYTASGNQSRGYEIGDLVSLVVIRVIRDKHKAYTSMKQEHLPENKKSFQLGKMDTSDPDTMPVHYVRLHDACTESPTYESLLQATPSFHNPASSLYLAKHLLKLHPADDTLTLFQNRASRVYEAKECAPYLRRVQNKKWASKPLALGIKALKEGQINISEQWLTKAIDMDPQSVDAYVARGCLFANCDNYAKALADYDRALRIDENHRNARSYCSRTLVAFAESVIHAGGQSAVTRIPVKAEKMLIKAIEIDANNASAKSAYEKYMGRPPVDILPLTPSSAAASKSQTPAQTISSPMPSTSSYMPSYSTAPPDPPAPTSTPAVTPVQEDVTEAPVLQLHQPPPPPPSPPSPRLEEGELPSSNESIPPPTAGKPPASAVTATSHIPPMAGLVQIRALSSESSSTRYGSPAASSSTSVERRSARCGSRSPIRKRRSSDRRSRSPIRRSRSPIRRSRSPIRRSRSPVRQRSRSPIRRQRSPSPEKKRPRPRSRSPIRSPIRAPNPPVAPPRTPPYGGRGVEEIPGIRRLPVAMPAGPRFTDPDSRFRPARPMSPPRRYREIPGPQGENRRMFNDRQPDYGHSRGRGDRRGGHPHDPQQQYYRRHQRGARQMSPRSQARFDRREQEDLDAIRNAFL